MQLLGGVGVSNTVKVTTITAGTGNLSWTGSGTLTVSYLVVAGGGGSARGGGGAGGWPYQ